MLDPGKCIYLLSKHPESKPKNHKTGITFATMGVNPMRVCSISHFRKNDEAKMIYAYFKAAIDQPDVRSFGNKNCSACYIEKDVYFHADVGKYLEKSGSILQRLWFCDISCIKTYFANLSSMNAWKERVDKWQKELPGK